MVRCGRPGALLDSATTIGWPSGRTSMTSAVKPICSNECWSQCAAFRQSARRSGSVLIDGMRSSSIKSPRSSSCRSRARASAASSTLLVVATSGFTPARAPDLRGMVVRMGGIDLQPFLDRVGSDLGMRARASPFLVVERFEDLQARLARPAHRLHGRLDRAVASEPLRVLGLVITGDLGIVLREQLAQADRSPDLAVAEMMGDLARSPLVAGRAVELVVLDAVQRIGDCLVAALVLANQVPPLLRFHAHLPR